MKQTNIHVIENNHAKFLESTNNLNLEKTNAYEPIMKER
jgi:hypothetical protein